MTSRSAPTKTTAAPNGLALWTFLWGAGCRRLHLATQGVPGARDVVVSTLPELLEAVEDERTSAQALAGLDYQLQAGFLEHWLDEIQHSAAARSARAIREDQRALKLERWLQGAGLTTYFIGKQRIGSVSDLASLPERGGDLTKLWEHIREGVPQERFKGDKATVYVLEQVRGSKDIPDRAKPLVVCLRLGLQRLPWAGRFLETLGDLEPAILEPGGREALRGLLESGVLQAWVDAVVPGRGAGVAAARGLDPAISVDRAVRGILGPAVYPVPGVKAADYAELVERAGGMLHTICGDPGARARIRDALFGPIRLPGAPPELRDPSEAELAQLHVDHRPNVFAWFALSLPILHLGASVVRSIDQYLAAIANPHVRAEAIRLASAGIVSLWYRRALGGSLSEALSGAVSEQGFPALCLEMGEPPPPVEVSWSDTSATIPDGGTAVFVASLSNRDTVRTAVLELSAVTKPPRGNVSLDGRVVLPPGASTIKQVTYPSPPGTSGQTHILVGVSYAAPRPVVVAATDLLVTSGFPWRNVLPPTLGWMVLVAAALVFFRLMLQPLAAALLYRGGAFELTQASNEAAALVGLGVAVGCFAIEHVIATRHRQFWPPKRLALTTNQARTAATALVFVALVVGYQRGLGTSLLFGVAAVGAVMVKLAEKDVAGAAIFAVWLLLGKELGSLVLLVLGGLDTIAILAASGFSISGGPSSLAIGGWAICGAFLGLAFGVAVALRGVSRPLEAEAARIAILAAAAILIALLGLASAPANAPTGSTVPRSQPTTVEG